MELSTGEHRMPADHSSRPSPPRHRGRWGWTVLRGGAVLGTVGHSAAPLTSAHSMPGAPPHPAVTITNVPKHCRVSSGNRIGPLRTVGLRGRLWESSSPKGCEVSCGEVMKEVWQGLALITWQGPSNSIKPNTRAQLMPMFSLRQPDHGPASMRLWDTKGRDASPYAS